VEYEKGKENVAADSLTRGDENDSSSLLTIIAVESEWINKVREMVESDSYFIDLKQKWRTCQRNSKLYQEKSGLIYYKGRILISPNSPLTQLLISEHHDTPQGGYSGYEKTLQRLKRIVYWRGQQYIRDCDTCQRSKYENLTPAGLMQPLSVPRQVWEEVTMDFIDCLPKSLGKSGIWVVVDRLTKFAHSFPFLILTLQKS